MENLVEVDENVEISNLVVVVYDAEDTGVWKESTGEGKSGGWWKYSGG